MSYDAGERQREIDKINAKYDKKDTKQKKPEPDMEAVAKTIGEVMDNVVEAMTPVFKTISDALGSIFKSFDMLAVLKLELARTPRYRLIRRYKLRRAIKNIEKERAK